MSGPAARSLALKEVGDQLTAASPALSMVFAEEEQATLRAICKDVSSGGLTPVNATLHCIKVATIRDLRKRIANAIGRGRVGAADIAADMERN